MESSAFFIQDEPTGNEIIIFGDIEPDSVSLEPRNQRVWEIAAPKIASGSLRAIFIECSYNDAVDDETLYGHLCPRHLIAELKVLASKVIEAKLPSQEREQQHERRRRGRSSKRKRQNSDVVDDDQVSPHSTRQITTSLIKPQDSSKSGRANESTQAPDFFSHRNNSFAAEQIQPEGAMADGDVDGDENDMLMQWTGPPPLEGFKVYIIHIKDTLTDGPHPSERILSELRAQSNDAGLGCEFYVPFQGEGILI